MSDHLTMSKSEAIKAVGGTQQKHLAEALGLSKQAVSDWDDPLTPIQRDRVQAYLFRRLMLRKRAPAVIRAADGAPEVPNPATSEARA